jgi:hypothetical protein
MKLQEEIKIISHLHQETFQHQFGIKVLNVDCTLDDFTFSHRTYFRSKN